MYHILIVDDEPILCEAMQLKINLLNTQHNLHIESITTASSVEEAIQIIEDTPVDILITDMKMPGQTGLDLIRYLKEKGSPIVSVILSGYSDFEYVRTAFQHGAVDYLLKPVKLTQLHEVLQKCIASLQEGTEKENTPKSPAASEKVFLSELEQYCNDLSTEHPRPDSQPPKDIELFLPFPYFAVAVFSKNEQFDIRDLIDRYAKENPLNIDPCFCFRDLYENTVILFNQASDTNPAAILDFLKKLHSYLEENRCFCRSALSNIQTGIHRYGHLYREAAYHLSYQMIRDFTVIAAFEDEISPKSEELNELYNKYSQKINFAFQTKDFERIHNLINNIFTREFFDGGSPSNIINFFHFYMIQVQNLSSSLNFSVDRGKNFYSFQNLNEIRLYLKEILYELQQKSDSSEENRYLPLINIAVQYIEENFNKDISMADVANSVSMSYNYFSKLFKEQTHHTFSEYLTEVRMREARILLKDPGNKIKDIALEVGYESVYSFSRAFKQYFGTSPKELKNK